MDTPATSADVIDDASSDTLETKESEHKQLTTAAAAAAVDEEEAASPLLDTTIRRSRKRRQAPTAGNAPTSTPAVAAASPATTAAPSHFDFDLPEPSSSSSEAAAAPPPSKLPRTYDTSAAVAADSSITAADGLPIASTHSTAPVEAADEFSFDTLIADSQPSATRRHTAVRSRRTVALRAEETEPEPAGDSNQGDSAAAAAASDTSAASAESALHSTVPAVYLIHSPAYARLLDLQSVHCGRMLYFTSLLRSLQAEQWRGLRILPPRRATLMEMEAFHSREYISAIRRLCTKYVRHATGAVELVHELSAAEKADQERFGLLDDCCVFPELMDLVEFTVGGSLRAVECLMAAHAASPMAPVTAIHWGGGRHHAEAECAKGFCFCGDAVCACLQLQSSSAYPRVLYLDLDLHHGDGVENAFSATRSVFTCSFHHWSPARFFPGSGNIDTQGQANAKHSLLNIPLREGIDDSTYCMLLDGVLSLLLPSYRPSVVVVCCGVDGLAFDRMSPFNLTTRTYARCVHMIKKRLGHFAAAAPTHDDIAAARTNGVTKHVAEGVGAVGEQKTNLAGSSDSDTNSSSTPATGAAAVASSPTWPPAPIPLLLLGGGGYNPLDSARAFVHMTAAACGQQLPTSIPDHERFLPAYLPNLSLHSLAKPASTLPNLNDREYLLSLMQHVRENCRLREAQEQQDELEEMQL